jgi:hypothetical protein
MKSHGRGALTCNLAFELKTLEHPSRMGGPVRPKELRVSLNADSLSAPVLTLLVQLCDHQGLATADYVIESAVESDPFCWSRCQGQAVAPVVIDAELIDQ